MSAQIFLKALAIRSFVLFVAGFTIYSPASGQNMTNTDLIDFFKRAMSATPDIETYVVGMRTPPSSAQTSEFHYYLGARSGSNFFISTVTNLSALRKTNAHCIIAGQAGGSQYGISGNLVTHIAGSNAYSDTIRLFSNLTRQFLDMGAVEIEPESVKWTQNTFTAKTSRGKMVIGELIISNNVPIKLEISSSTNPSPYKIIGYRYPTPATLLAGFPEDVIVSDKIKDVLMPKVEIMFQNVRLAEQGLPQSFFSEDRFNAFLGYTNAITNADLYVYNTKHTNLVPVPKTLLTSGGYTNSRPHFVIFIGFALAVIIPVLVAVHLRHNRQQIDQVKHKT